MMEGNYSNMGVGPDPTSSFTFDQRGLQMGAAVPFPNPTFPRSLGGPIDQRNLFIGAAAPFPNYPSSSFTPICGPIDQRGFFTGAAAPFPNSTSSFTTYYDQRGLFTGAGAPVPNPSSSFPPRYPFEFGGPIDQRGLFTGAPFPSPTSTLYTLPNELFLDPYVFGGFPFHGFVAPPDHYDDEAGFDNDLEKGGEVAGLGEKCKDLYHAAINGNWKTAEGILRDNPSYARDSITKRKDTLLHIAAVGGNTLFVRKVVEMLKSEELEVVNEYGCTAFYNAVASGVVENAKCMIEMNQNLISIGAGGADSNNNNKIAPIYQAALLRHNKMVSYLYTVKPLVDYLDRKDLIKLLVMTIYNDMHDAALKILKDNSQEEKYILKDRTIALAKFKGNRSFLHMLVRKQQQHIAPEGIWRRFLAAASTTALFSKPAFCKNVEEEKDQCVAKTKAGELLDIIWKEYCNLSDDEFRKEIGRQDDILHYAAKHGNAEFLDMVLKSKPDLFCEINKSGHTILHVAVLYRQQNVVNYICNKQGYQYYMARRLDLNNNNILHLAAQAENTFCESKDNIAADDYLWIYDDDEEEKKEVPENKKNDDQEEKENIIQESSAPQTSTTSQKEVVPENKKKDDQEEKENIMQESSARRISTATQKEVIPVNMKRNYQQEENIMQESSALGLSTAALHYEREISWFKGVEKIVPSSFRHMRNKDGKTPKQLFLKEHMQLKMNAEKSIRGTADSCMIVATLIATVAFSAAFTAPGGNDDQTGIPIFIKRASFTVFTISDAVAMIFSMVSILTFLSILIWRNTDDDFHLALKRLFVGFAAMGVSICGMLFAFTAAFFLVYGRAWQPILIAAFVALPIASFLYLNTRLWIDVVGSMLLKLLPFTKQTTYVGCRSRP
nr:ankyrin repeat-containing protein At3g12360-like isoform X1 [Ipomoea batatas]